MRGWGGGGGSRIFSPGDGGAYRAAELPLPDQIPRYDTGGSPRPIFLGPSYEFNKNIFKETSLGIKVTESRDVYFFKGINILISTLSMR